MNTYGIILASGTGERMNTQVPKQFTKVAGKTVLEHTIEIFEKNEKITHVIIVIHRNHIDFCKSLILKNNYKKVYKALIGGATRQESSFIGISAIEDAEANVLIHDGVRPFLSEKIIDNCVEALKKYDAIDVAIPSSDTIIQINDKKIIENIPQRKNYMRGQTPQCFKLSLIKKAHKLAQFDKSISVTDDCGLVKHYGLADIFVVDGEEANIKITHPLDAYIADKLFQIKSSVPPNEELVNLKDKVVVIFGASRGIGLATKKLAQRYKAKVWGFSRSNNIDITDEKSVEDALKEVFNKESRIDYIINTAGVLKMGKLESRSIEDIKSEIDINYFGSINVIKQSLPYLKNSKGSILLYTSSSHTRGRALYSIYSSSKAALVNLTQALAEEYFEDNVRINIINPERTATPMRFENFGKEPLESLLNADDVANASLKVLLSDYTGQTVDVRRV